MKIIKFITKKLSDPDPLIIDRIRIRIRIRIPGCQLE